MWFFDSPDGTACCSARRVANVVSSVKVTRTGPLTAKISRRKLFSTAVIWQGKHRRLTKSRFWRKICRRTQREMGLKTPNFGSVLMGGVGEILCRWIKSTATSDHRAEFRGNRPAGFLRTKV